MRAFEDEYGEDGTMYYRRRKAEDRALQRIDRQAARYRRKQDDLYGKLLEKLFPRRRKVNWPAWVLLLVMLMGAAYVAGHFGAWWVR